MKLDKSRPFFTVHGTSEAAYEQDGILFDFNGDSIGDEPEAPKNRGGRPKKVEPEPAVDPEIEAQIKAASEV